jgi:hypothetical protein
MKSHLFIAIIFFTCSSFFIGYRIQMRLSMNSNFVSSSNNTLDFTVHRLSGERVYVSWHTENESSHVIFEVLRKHEKHATFFSLGMVEPKFWNINTADYSFIDTNNFSDSSYYCLKKIDTDSVVFYSVTKAVEGVRRER